MADLYCSPPAGCSHMIHLSIQSVVTLYSLEIGLWSWTLNITYVKFRLHTLKSSQNPLLFTLQFDIMWNTSVSVQSTQSTHQLAVKSQTTWNSTRRNHWLIWTLKYICSWKHRKWCKKKQKQKKTNKMILIPQEMVKWTIWKKNNIVFWGFFESQGK